MAKTRQTNVNINYTVNTVDIERGNGLLVRASKATDDLRKATDTYSKQAATGYRFTSRSIEGMSIEVARLKQQVKLASVQNTADVQRLSAQYKSAKAQLDQYNRSLLETSRHAKTAAVSSRDLATGFGEVYTAIKTIIAAGIAKELISVTLEMAKLSGTVEGVTIAFDKLPNSTLLLEKLRAATHGTVTDLELMQKALRANNFRIPLEKLGVLLEFAAVKAQQTGQEVNHLVEYIVSGIGYRSIKRLDDLGFTANRVNKALGDVSLQAASMQQIMDAVTKLMNEDLQQTGGYAETAATQVGQIETAWHDLRVEVAKKLENSALLNFFKIALQGARDFVESVPVKEMKELFSLNWKKISPIFILGQTLDVFAAWGQNLDDVAEKHAIAANAAAEAGRIEERIAEFTREQRIPLIEEEIRKKEKVADEYFHQIQAMDMTLDKYSEENIARKLNLREIEATILLLKDLKKAQEDTGLEDPAKPKGGRQKPPRAVTQVVDIRFRDPVTGTISKWNEGKVMKDFAMAAQKVVDSLPPVEIKVQPTIFLTDWERAWEENRAAIIDIGSNILQDQIDSVMSAEVQRFDALIDETKRFYDEQIALAGDNERAKDELRIKEDRKLQKLEKERADREKKAAKAGIRVATALGIMKVFTESGLSFADKIIKSLIVAAMGASQYAIAGRERYYAKGVIDLKGPGTKTSDSIKANLSKGESVMTADETSSSKGIFKAVRARKLNDRVMQEIVSGRSGGSSGVAFDDSRLLKKLDEVKNSQPDLIKRTNLIYESRKDGDNYKRTIRSKSMGT